MTPRSNHRVAESTGLPFVALAYSIHSSVITTARWFSPANAALGHLAQRTPDAMYESNEIAIMVRHWVATDRIRIITGAVTLLR